MKWPDLELSSLNQRLTCNDLPSFTVASCRCTFCHTQASPYSYVHPCYSLPSSGSTAQIFPSSTSSQWSRVVLRGYSIILFFYILLYPAGFVLCVESGTPHCLSFLLSNLFWPFYGSTTYQTHLLICQFPCQSPGLCAIQISRAKAILLSRCSGIRRSSMFGHKELLVSS